VTSVDPENLGAQYAEAIRAWAGQHPTVTWLDLMNIHDTAASADELRGILADPEAWITAHPEIQAKK
jgi:hypothetical protein